MKKHLFAAAAISVMSLATAFGYEYMRTPAEASAPIQAISILREAGDSFASSSEVTSGRVFAIQQDGSSARFIIDEILRGEPFTVVGTTNQVAGQIAVNPDQPGGAQLGTILVNARTITTDSDQRNRMIKNQILESDTYEFISFTPVTISGLPANTTVGETYPVQIAGELTIRNVTRNVTFDATITPASDNRIEGNAQTAIRYADWGISIPQVPFVAGVSDDVRIELSFVAAAA